MNITDSDGRAVVVGIDTAEESWPVLAYAIHAALLRRSPLEIVHFTCTQDEAQSGREIVGAAVVRAERVVRGAVPVSGRPLPGSPANGLVDASARAALLVIGRGHGSGTAGRPSVARQVAQRSLAPVVVVPPVWAAPGKTRCVTLAVNDSDHNEHLLDAAFRAAAVEGDELTVLHVWRPAGLDEAAYARIGGSDWLPADVGERRERLEKSVAATAERFPRTRHAVEVMPALSSPAQALAEASDWSVLVVVGRPDEAYDKGAHDSVVSALTERALCPVLVVPRPTAAAS